MYNETKIKIKTSLIYIILVLSHQNINNPRPKDNFI